MSPGTGQRKKNSLQPWIRKQGSAGTLGVTGAGSLDVVVEASQVIGAVNLQDVGARFPGGWKGHWAMRNKWRK